MENNLTPPISPEMTNGTIKRHIRTFAGDIESLQKGETIEIESSEKPIQSQTPADRLVARSPIAPIPTVISTPSPVPQPQIQESPIPAPKLNKPSPIETYEGDFFNRMKETNASPATVIAAEQDAGRQTYDEEPEKKSLTGIIFLIIGIFLLGAGGFGIYFAYSYFISKTTTEVFVSFVSAPIFVDESKEISGTGNALLREIKQSIVSPLSPGSVRFLYTANATTTSNSVFSALQLPAPNILLRNIIAENSMAGIVNLNGNQSPFFILSVASYSNTFSGMLTWERTMPKNLNQLFPQFTDVPLNQTATSTTMATTTKTIATTTPEIQTTTSGFRDEIVSNHDVRVYRDSAGRSVLLYGYWNQNTLVIARDPAAFTEILNRLANSRT